MERFYTRGIGLNSILCFVCSRGASWGDVIEEAAKVQSKEEIGTFRFSHGSCQPDMAAFVDNLVSANRIMDMFDNKCSLDYRDYEPQRIQVKVGACQDHVENLRYLSRLTSCGFICKEKIELARNPEQQLHLTAPEERLKGYLSDLEKGKAVDIKEALLDIQQGFKWLYHNR